MNFVRKRWEGYNRVIKSRTLQTRDSSSCSRVSVIVIPNKHREGVTEVWREGGGVKAGEIRGEKRKKAEGGVKRGGGGGVN